MPAENFDRTPSVVAALESRARRVVASGAGVRVVWRRWGMGPPLVLVHGAAGSWTHWIRNIPALAEQFSVLTPDLPGFGDSDGLGEPHTVEHLADAVVAGLDELVPPSGHVRLAGFSFGAIVAGHVAARLGGRAAAVVLIGAGGLAFPSEAAGLTLRRLVPGMSDAEARDVHRANLRLLMFGDPAAADDLAVQLQIDNIRRTRFRSGDIPQSDALLRVLPEIRAPLAAIWGGRDAFVAPYFAERRASLARVHPDVDVRVVEGAGHWVNYEAAEAINRALLEILSRARPRDLRDSS
jgi:pimeloyl-ACP methyl ester carboxylesterase